MKSSCRVASNRFLQVALLTVFAGLVPLPCASAGYPEQASPPIALDRLDSRKQNLDGVFGYSESGKNIHVYVVSTGISDHTGFESRVDRTHAYPPGGQGPTDDCNGRGTHLAGVVGSKEFGVAKEVFLHPVRLTGAGDCGDSAGFNATVTALQWILDNVKYSPAVVLLDRAGLVTSNQTLEDKVAALISRGLIVVVPAGDHDVANAQAGHDACQISPARVSGAITVGNVDPKSVGRHPSSNYGRCLDIFAPGVDVQSTKHDDANGVAVGRTGTAIAAAHVAGVVALFLEYHASATPAQVYSGLMKAAIKGGDPNWSGIQDPGFQSPDLMLHWGPTSDGSHDGDPHVLTVDGYKYDFQAAGEFVLLRDGGDLEIQTRQRPVSTVAPSGDGVQGGVEINVCVSITSAVAVGWPKTKLTFQGGTSAGNAVIEIRLNGKVLTSSSHTGTTSVNGGTLSIFDNNKAEVVAPDGSRVILNYLWWVGQDTWYFNVDVQNTRASAGIMGSRPLGSWLPALPDGKPVKARPSTMLGRYKVLYGDFADAWRVDSKTSLFYYGGNESPATYADLNWPPLPGEPCAHSLSKMTTPITKNEAENICRNIDDEYARQNCIADVSATGEKSFAGLYSRKATQRRQNRSDAK